MCKHYANDLEAMRQLSTWRDYIGSSLTPLPALARDVRPKRPAVIVRQEDGRTFVEAMQWGVPMTMPGRQSGTSVTKAVTNVRNLASPIWRVTLNKPEQRCLVPFNCFTERKQNVGREEVWFSVKEQPVAAFAGLWRSVGGVHVFALLTCRPNSPVATEHPRAMPVVLHPKDYEAWLTTDYADACALAVPFPSQLMVMGRQ